jgi:hypothetical protein
MDYFVIGPDGKEYGPASLDTLRSWVAENRILPTTMLKSQQSGLTVAASSIAALFPQSPPQVTAPPVGDWSRPPTAAASYPRSGPGGPRLYTDDGKMDVVWAIVRSALALVFFFVLGGLGVIISIYAIVYAFRAREKGHKLANVGIAISVATLVLICIGWALRLNGHMPTQQ